MAEARSACADRFVDHARGLERGIADKDDAAIRALAHQLAGTAGSFGFDAVHDAARSALAAADSDDLKVEAQRLVDALKEARRP